MQLVQTRSYNPMLQLLMCLLLVASVAGLSFAFRELIGYKVVALLLLLTVSIIAMLFDIVPVLVSASVSALVWNFFFIPPIFTFHVDNAEDLLLFSMYFIIALVNTVLSYKIRIEQRKVQQQEEKEKQLAFHNHLLNSLSHELRTPITTIIGAADTLRGSGDRLSGAQQAQLLGAIETAGLRLNRQVENLLHSGRMHAGALYPKLDWCDTNELIFHVIHQLDTHTHTVRYEPKETTPLVLTDRGLAEQLLLNLLHNALTYTPAGTIVAIRSAIESGDWVLEVADNGGGVEPDALPFLFDTFYRAPHAKAGGTGLGLSIVKGFTAVLGGTVSATNNSNRGLTVEIRLPVQLSYMNQLHHE